MHGRRSELGNAPMEARHVPENPMKNRAFGIIMLKPYEKLGFLITYKYVISIKIFIFPLN